MKSSDRLGKKGIGTTFLLITALVVMTGCAATPATNGAGADTQSMADMTIECTIILALANEPTLSGENILVSCVSGDVTLFGDVDSSRMRTLAENTIRTLGGIHNLRNGISVI